jgi:RNA polymerase sigma factor (sigma-70 family)
MPMHLEDEAALVAQAQRGDEDAFKRLYDQCSREVYRLALHLTHDRRDAEDLLQRTFLKAFVNLREFGKELRFCTWLTSIAVDEALARFARWAPQEQISLDPPMEVAKPIESPHQRCKP